MQSVARQSLRRARRERLPRARAEAFAQGIEIARFGQHVAAVGVEQAQVGAQVRLDRGFVEIDGRDLHAGHALEEARKRAGELRRPPRLRMRLGECAREIRRRHEVAAQRLGQRLDQRRRLVGDEARRQPRQPRRIQRIEQVQRHDHGHAIVDRARFEAVAHVQARFAERDERREAVGIAAVGHQQVVARPFQRFLLLRRQLRVPGIQRLRA